MKTIAASMIALAVCGCGNQDESVAKRAGNQVGQTFTDFASGVGKGIDKRMMVNVQLSEEVTKRGLSKTVANSTGIDRKPKGINVYFIASSPFQGKLVAKAINHQGQEIGRSVVDVEFSADDAQYVTFTFAEEMDSQLVQQYVVDIKK